MPQFLRRFALSQGDQSNDGWGDFSPERAFSLRASFLEIRGALKILLYFNWRFFGIPKSQMLGS